MFFSSHITTYFCVSQWIHTLFQETLVSVILHVLARVQTKLLSRTKLKKLANPISTQFSLPKGYSSMLLNMLSESGYPSLTPLSIGISFPFFVQNTTLISHQNFLVHSFTTLDKPHGNQSCLMMNWVESLIKVYMNAKVISISYPLDFSTI